jgi:hypothetical protein
MAGQFLPPAELTPSLPAALSARQRIELWMQLMDACELFLLGGLRRQVGPDGNVPEAYRRWYAESMAEHDAAMVHLLQEFQRRSHGHAG